MWLKSIMNLPVLFGYNERGDRVEHPEFVERNTDVAFYQTSTKRAIQTVVVYDQPLEDQAGIQKLIHVKANRALSDGSAVEKVAILVPSREDALTVKREIDRLGIDEVLYPDDEGAWWNPFPEGDWIT